MICLPNIIISVWYLDVYQIANHSKETLTQDFMNLSIPPSFIFSIMIFGVMILPMYLILYLYNKSSRYRKSPLNISLLRGPGQNLAEQVQEHTVELTAWILIIPLFFLTIPASYGVDRFFGASGASAYIYYFLTFLCLCIAVYCGIKAYKLFNKRNLLRLGYECEQAVGQDLNELINFGFKVYHDFPADGFNIDHIAIGPTGVFAIETKGRAKQLDIDKPNWMLQFDGISLQFPTWSERKPIEQAKRQANWLSKWLESATGEPQQAVPVLAIPGWYIKRTKPSEFLIYNGRNPQFLAKGRPVVLSDKRIKAISHQVEGKCRDVKLRSYRKNI